MKIKIEIKHWVTGVVLFEYEKEDNTLRETILEAIKSSANLRYADLRSANLRYADLRYADLSSANLSSADLRSANLRSADLRSADLRSANLRYADLRYANLSYANLSSANLRYANLRYADLSSANLSYAKNITDDYIDFWWHLHHEILYELLTEPLRARINYIKKEKPENEIELRLKLIKPVLGDIPTSQKGWEKLHKIECGCGWDGKTIFTKKNGWKV